MEALPPVFPSVVLPPSPTSSLHLHRRRIALFGGCPPAASASHGRAAGFLSSRVDRGSGIPPREGDDQSTGDEEEEDVERALRLDGTLPGTSGEFVKRVSSRAYVPLHQSFDSSSYDVLEVNPWRDSSKPVYVLTHGENQLCTMKTRRNRGRERAEYAVHQSWKVVYRWPTEAV